MTDRVLKSNSERADVIAKFVEHASSAYVLPLFLLFSLADFFWYKDFFYQFLTIRVAAVICLAVVGRLVKFSNISLIKVEITATFFILLCVAPIQYMIWALPNVDSPYYGGLVLIIVGIATGIRYTWKFYFVNLAIIYIPYLAIGFMAKEPGFFLLNLVFFVSVGAIATIGRLFFEKMNIREFNTRLQLEMEIDSRGEIIREKTAETVKLNSLSKQFSPQVIKSIKDGSINFQSTHTKEICAIFIDIKDSTSRFLILESEDLQKVISMYMEDVMGVLLKYDITIDKFLGDGVLGFSNDPVAQDDYIERVIRASFEVIERLKMKSMVYKALWKSEMDVRIGIATGFASVGFYGSDLHVKSYTALGKVMNLASRVNGVGGINEITVSQDVLEKLEKKKSMIMNELTIVDLGNAALKGFEQENIKIFKLIDRVEHKLSTIDEEVCPSGHGPLFLHNNENGIYVLKCRYCEFILDEQSAVVKNVA
jgi:class 3 adenylate cyclase